MVYTGSCHCGSVRFEVEGSIDSALSCNCSMCQRRGSLLWFAPRDACRLAPASNPGTYLFNKHVIKHRFCATCAIHVFGEGTAPDGRPIAAVNIRCVDGIDLDAVPVERFDGRSK